MVFAMTSSKISHVFVSKYNPQARRLGPRCKTMERWKAERRPDYLNLREVAAKCFLTDHYTSRLKNTRSSVNINQGEGENKRKSTQCKLSISKEIIK